MNMLHNGIADIVKVIFFSETNQVMHIIMHPVFGREEGQVEYSDLHPGRNSLNQVLVKGVHSLFRIFEIFNNSRINSQVLCRTMKYCIREITERHHGSELQFQKRNIA